MNEVWILSLIVSIFAFNIAFCMNPSSWKPPPPSNVVFGECFFVPEITGTALLDEVNYSYRHICRQECTENEPQRPEHERNWYFVGLLKDSGTKSQNLRLRNYIPINQSRIQFISLRGMEVKFELKFTTREFKITFQSLQQRQAFYGMVYHNVNLSKAAPNKIGVLHEISIEEDGTIGDNREIGYNVEALCENINLFWYITLKNEQGPIQIFPPIEASITRMKQTLVNKQQLLLQAQGTYYILTFSSFAESKQFSDAITEYITEQLCMKNLDPNLTYRFKFNQISLNL